MVYCITPDLTVKLLLAFKAQALRYRGQGGLEVFDKFYPVSLVYPDPVHLYMGLASRMLHLKKRPFLPSFS